MAKSDIRLIIQGGALCAAFSFMIFLIPILGIFTNFFSLLPIFYVGICLGFKECLLASLIPLAGYTILFGLFGIGIFGIAIFIPTASILYWHFLKEKNTYKFSATDILSRLAIWSIVVAAIGFSYLKLTNSTIFETLAQKIEIATKLAKAPSAPALLIQIFPGIAAISGLVMVWLNYQIAYILALKANKSIRKPSAKQNIFLPPYWDVAFFTALWLILANDLFIESFLLGIFSRTALCICAFPLLIDGLGIAQLMAKYYKIPRAVIVIFAIVTFSLVWPMIFVVVLGLVEPLYGLKKKYYSKAN